MLRPGFLS